MPNLSSVILIEVIENESPLSSFIWRDLEPGHWGGDETKTANYLNVFGFFPRNAGHLNSTSAPMLSAKDSVNMITH